jgi:acetyl-CoA carboxylase biotin carboxyl carrier protein
MGLPVSRKGLTVDDAKHSPSPGPFDVGTVRELVELMNKFDLSEVDLNDGDQRIRLRRGGRLVSATPPAFAMSLPNSVGVAPQSATTPMPPAAPTKKQLEIKSELVGTFYAKPAPDKEDYVKVGSRVSPDTVVCKVEAMKIFNDITAKVSGTITEVCVQNAQFVEFDQVLFRVEPS